MEEEHRWDVTPQEARRIQSELRERLVTEPPPGFAPRLAGGADVSFERFAKWGYAGVVVLELAGLETVAEASAVAELTFPYVPGYLSFRELPPIAAAWERLERRPDVLVFDGQGTAHPRRFGVACHGGLLLDVPSIGCAKSLLVGTHGELGEERGSTAPLVHRGETVGMAVRTRTGVKPVYVSPGHRMDLPTAVEIVLRLAPRFREPETTRRSHRLVNELRRRARDDAAPGTNA
ncbi:MAG TPA: deoxyribonuclease V [Longimicrobiaceae bacterium]|nr:deoxyribonuclease V [Longimicrobiaceae bacterium]